jgi:membrane fusion protein (multidrug efflux system)
MTGPQQIQVQQAKAGSANAVVQTRQAAVAQARLNLGYTTIVSPVNGITGKRNVQVGQVIQPGQPTTSVVDLDDMWVTANFKETQLKNMRPNQPAKIHVDAYDGDLNGHVMSIGGATGARFSLLPPENATGNYVKVVQRVPVRIALDPGQDQERRLRPGMSVVVTVITK